MSQQVQLQQWSGFFSIISGVAATLLGLLFVVVTISPSVGRKLASKSRVYLTPAILYLTSVLIMSATLAVPNQTRFSAAICICVLGLGGLLYVGRLIFLRSEFYEKKTDRLRYAVAPFTAYVALLTGGFLLAEKGVLGLDIVAAGMIMLLNSAIQNSWSLAVSILSSE
jgi:hypothetical protein